MGCCATGSEVWLCPVLALLPQCAKLPAGVRHVVVVATVPTIYPSVPGVEDAMSKYCSGITAAKWDRHHARSEGKGGCCGVC